MDIKLIQYLLNEGVPDDFNVYTPQDINDKILFNIQYVLDEIKFQIDKEINRQEKLFLLG